MVTKLATNRSNVLPDMMAGATVALVKTPQSMANAVLASANPLAGLYGLMIALPLGAIFSSSVYVGVAPSSALAISAGEALYYTPENEKIGALALLVVMVGIAQITFGLAGFGRLTRYISNSVMKGFISGIAVLIIIASLRDITGFQSQQENQLLRLADIALNWRTFDQVACCVGLCTILIYFLCEKTRLSKFSPVLALATTSTIAILISALNQDVVVPRIGDVAYLSTASQTLVIPNLEKVPELALPALSIAIVGLVQGAGVGQTFPNPNGRFPDASNDFTGQGVANFVSGFVGGVPSSASLSGTAINIKAGAQSRWANIFAGGFVFCISFLLLDLVFLIPVSAIGGLLFVVGVHSIQPATIKEIWKTSFASRVAFCGTALATLILPLHLAILVGVAVSILLQVSHLANRIDVRQLVLTEGGFPIDLPAPTSLTENEVCVIYLRGVLFFASVHSLEAKLPSPVPGKPAVLVLVLRDTDEVGSTIVRSLMQYAKDLDAAGNRLVFAGLNEALFNQLNRTNLIKQLQAQNVFKERDHSGSSVNDAVVQSRAWIESFRKT